MSTEITTLLAQAAPSPARALDAGAIIRRGDRIRTRRMLATVLAVPVVVSALWVGARVGLSGPIETPPAAPSSCEWRAKAVAVVLKADTPRRQIVELAEQVRQIDHVESVEWFDLWEKTATLTRDVPNLREFLTRRAFPPWLEIRLDDPAYAGAVVANLPASPIVDTVAGENRNVAECRFERLERRNEVLEKQVRDVLKRLEREMRRRR